MTKKEYPLLRGQKSLIPVWVIAHRGGRALAPDNTLEAFEKTIQMGTHMLECDIQLTKDNIPIVFHDTSLLNCTNALQKFPNKTSYLVSDFTLKQIRQLEVGSWYVKEITKTKNRRQFPYQFLTRHELVQLIPKEERIKYSSGKIKIPTLRELLELVYEYKCYLNIEIKYLPLCCPDITEKVIAAVNELEMAHQIILSSFDHYQLILSKKIQPQIATGALFRERIFEPGRYCVEILQADAYHPSCVGHMDSTGLQSQHFKATGKIAEESIQNVLDWGLNVSVWSVNHSEDIKALVEIGVNGICTDYPNRAIATLKELAMWQNL